MNLDFVSSLCQNPPQYETLALGASSKTLNIQVTYNGKTVECVQTFEQEMAYSLILYPEIIETKCKLVSVSEKLAPTHQFRLKRKSMCVIRFDMKVFRGIVIDNNIKPCEQ